MTSCLKKLRCSEEQRTPPRRLASPLASSPAVLLEHPPTHTPPPQKYRGAVCFPASWQRDHTCVRSAPCRDTDFGRPWGCGTYFMQNKAHSWGYLHNKSCYKGHKTQQTSLMLQMQVCPSPASQRKSTWEPSQQPSILLGTAQRSITSYKVYSTASAQVEEQRKSLLKMLRAAIKQPPPRTQAPPAHGRWKSRPGGHAAREHDSARPLFLHLGSAAEPQAVSKSGAGRRLQSELTLAAGKGRD